MKLGLVLAGGGIRGIAHAGVLQALEENNIKVDVIGGTSSGGIIASLYAMGYNPKQILKLFNDRYEKRKLESSIKSDSSLKTGRSVIQKNGK